ncbi:MAG: hypothetical protein AAGB46_12595 [Verrucomicrobiota bacterium]
MKKVFSVIAVLAAFASFPCFGSIGDAVESVEKSLKDSLLELAELRKEVAEKKAPLSKELNRLNLEVNDLRQAFEKASRTRDTKGLDLSSLENNIKLTM